MTAAAAKNVRFDLDLTGRDIQALSSADALAAFFARLGYDTNARIVQTPGNLGINTEGTLRPIKRIELISDREGLFQVYLFELASVTVAHTRSLARAFRNRAGNFLLVLTSDYERLDFVLLERFLPPAAPGGTIGERQVGIRPRTLTVERRNADRRTLRVLKRLTWTETDGFAQHDKLIAAYSVADWSEEHFNNRALFSDYYLKERLTSFPEWREDPKPAYTALRTLYLGTFERFARKPVAELKKGLVEPVLAALGFEPHGGKAAPSHETPDYLLHAPRGKDALASLLVYPWARSLDGKDFERDSETPDENPGAIVVSLLEKNEVPWVIVTNGRLWRLYARQTHSRASNYYELDAEELLADTGTPLADPGKAFRYFWLLFRRQAFEKHPAQREGKTQDLSLLDRLLLESEDYARDLGSRLKDRVFEEVFPHLAHGFVEHVRTQSGTKTVPQAELDTIYQGTLTLLYRLLFLLYAEARDLLPVREVRGFWEASLVRMKKEIAEHAEDIEDQVEGQLKKAYRDDAYSLWDRLQRLFAIVDRGEAALNVPFYNGGLFLTKPDAGDDTPEAVAARFLATHKVADRDLARALDLMSRTVDEKLHSLVFIDYKSLGVRQLGSIYEGLLEFKVRIADEKLGITKEKGREVYVPFSELEEKVQDRAERAGRFVKKGAVYLENDKRERKASGSYYTPDYIVEYIVEHAVGPMLTEKFDKMRPKLRKAQAEHKNFFERQKALAAKRIAPEPVEKAERIGEELVDELFDIKVLDPAMGSGHFLVEAVDFITDRMLTFLNAFPWNPVQAYLARMRDAILVEGESQGVTLDPAKLTDVNLLKRHVLKRCIYGVDLNPMAVELAKVSLWLDCFTLGAPLSFLDHHLRCGNSLIGITEKQFEESQKRWGQMDLLGGSQYAGAKMAVGAMIAIGALPDITPAQTRESRKQFGIAAGALAPVKRFFDVYTSQWFGNEARKVGRGKGELNPAIDFLRDPMCSAWAQDTAKAKLPEHFAKVSATAAAASAEHRFFHWELEFPEVFFGPRPGTIQSIDRMDGAGFDAIIGNPPWGKPSEFAKNFLKQAFKDVLQRLPDQFAFFLRQASALCCNGGIYGSIVPQVFLFQSEYSRLRLLLVDQRGLNSCNDLGDGVFEGVVAPCCVLTGHVGRATDSIAIRNLRSSPHALTESVGKDGAQTVLRRTVVESVDHVIITSDFGVNGVLQNLMGRCIALGEEYSVTQGVQTGGDRAFVLTELEANQKNLEATYLRPTLFGENIEQYLLKPANYVVLYVTRDDKARAIPNIVQHLRAWYSELKEVSEVKAGIRDWYTLHRPRNEDVFKHPKLLLRQTGDRLVAVADVKSYFPIDSLLCVSALKPKPRYDLKVLAALLNSRFFQRIYDVLVQEEGRTFSQVKPRNIEKLPLIQQSKDGFDYDRRLAEIRERYSEEHLIGAPSKVRRVVGGMQHEEASSPFPGLLGVLADEMMTLAAAMHREQKRFLARLGKLTNDQSKISNEQQWEAWVGKSRLLGYGGKIEKGIPPLTWGEMRDLVRRNAPRAIEAAASASRGESLIRTEFEGSLAILEPMRVRAVRIKSAIDELIYCWYGLTEEEIKLFASKSSDVMS